MNQHYQLFADIYTTLATPLATPLNLFLEMFNFVSFTYFSIMIKSWLVLTIISSFGNKFWTNSLASFQIEYAVIFSVIRAFIDEKTIPHKRYDINFCQINFMIGVRIWQMTDFLLFELVAASVCTRKHIILRKVWKIHMKFRRDQEQQTQRNKKRRRSWKNHRLRWTQSCHNAKVRCFFLLLDLSIIWNIVRRIHAIKMCLNEISSVCL